MIISSELIGLNRAKAMIMGKEITLMSSVKAIALKTITELQKESKQRTPKRTGLLRGNTEIATSFGRKPRSTVRTRTRKQYLASRKLKKNLPVSGISNYLAVRRSTVRASAFNLLPYAWAIDKKGGINAPWGFLSDLDRKYQRIFRLRIRASIDRLSRI